MTKATGKPFKDVLARNTSTLRLFLKTRKAPGAKYTTVTQDTSPSDVVEVRDEYLFGRVKAGSLGQVTTKKTHQKKAYY